MQTLVYSDNWQIVFWISIDYYNKHVNRFRSIYYLYLCLYDSHELIHQKNLVT